MYFFFVLENCRLWISC